MSGAVTITPANGGNVVTWNEECGVMREPIIAWRHIVCPHDQSVYTWPVTVEGTGDLHDDRFAIEMPGRGATMPYVIPHNASFATLDDLIEYWRLGAGL